MFTNLRLSVNQCAGHLDKHLLNINIESLRHSRSKLEQERPMWPNAHSIFILSERPARSGSKIAVFQFIL